MVWQSGLSKLLSDIKIRGKVAVGLNPNIRFYRYKVGQRFGRHHIDESVDLGEGKHTVYTLLVYLSGAAKTKDKSDSNNTKDSASEPIVGGETVFYGSRNRVVAEASSLYGLFYIILVAPLPKQQFPFSLCFNFSNSYSVICMYGLLWISFSDVIVTMQVAPAEGMALLHIHGDKCMLHEARNVSKGINLVRLNGRHFSEQTTQQAKWTSSINTSSYISNLLSPLEK
ncbi:Oxoglutarate/iron-dependent dioxygenase [Gossypium australe]|uniref:Oxoglutarate/iron-dependent dioxygenase n=1 Tax=Gossypium australe TaxID=47621 RepID=A0A5B6TWE8_9ROSI|nr:Oxoglutarate/iron-dependent dioxygenase [Gossypium australe]